VDEAPVEIGEVRVPLELLERPLWAVHAPAEVGPVTEIEVAVWAALAMALGADREPRRAEIEPFGVEGRALASVPGEHGFGIGVDLERRHHRRARRKERLEVVALPADADALRDRVVVPAEVAKAERHVGELVLREREHAGAPRGPEATAGEAHRDLEPVRLDGDALGRVG